MLLLLLFAWPPVHEVCPNYEVAMFQPWTGTSLDLVSIDNYYVAMILSTTALFLSAARCPPGGGGNPILPLLSLHSRPSFPHTGLPTNPGVPCINTRILIYFAPLFRFYYLLPSPALSTPSGFPSQLPHASDVQGK